MKHTPGPWKAFVSYGVICVHLASDDTPHLTEIVPWTGFDSCDVKSFSERVANAHLIAAAPDLLAACEDVLRELSMMPDASRDFLCPEWREEDLRDAIAKARGETGTDVHED